MKTNYNISNILLQLLYSPQSAITKVVLLSWWVLCYSFVSCTDELATSLSDQPSLSVDTLKIGTLLAGNSSKTFEVKLYNHCKAELKLTSINLRLAPESGYRINVDGMNGTSFTQSDLLRIAKGDSMFILVEATFPEKETGLVQHIDYIDILCNDRLQTIVLEAQNKEVIKRRGEIITSDTIWKHGIDIQIFDSLVIPQGVKLTISDSTTLYLHDKANIYVRGTLECIGQRGKPVIIRGDRTDNMFPDLPYDNLPSQWGSLYIDSTAHDCRFIFTDIHGMNDGIHIDSTDVIFDCCHIKNSDDNLLTCQMSQVTMQNCELSNAAGALVDLHGGWYDITHCTLANYNFSAVASLPALCLSNYTMDPKTEKAKITHLHHCNMLNTLIYGKWQNPDVQLEFYRPKSSLETIITTDSIFNYRFDHCLLRADGRDDNDFIQTLWNQDPLYQLIDSRHYSFDFHLQPESPAIGKGSSDGSTLCPLDMEGVQRPTVPSIGCYEYKK